MSEQDAPLLAGDLPAYDAVVLAGGAARRLGGVDKPALEVGGCTLLARVVGAVDDAASTVVVGPERPLPRPVRWVSEEPAGGGPVAALAAGLSLVTSDWTALLAADLPFLDQGAVRALRRAAVDGAGALLVDDQDRDQLLVGVWRTEALRTALPDVVGGAALRAVLLPLAPRRLRLAGRAWFDCDTQDDLIFARVGA